MNICIINCTNLTKQIKRIINILVFILIIIHTLENYFMGLTCVYVLLNFGERQFDRWGIKLISYNWNWINYVC